jgi:hypothetical protein
MSVRCPGEERGDPHHPLKDVAAAGGWTDSETLLNCYQQADPGTMLAVMSEPTRVRELVAQQ